MPGREMQVEADTVDQIQLQEHTLVIENKMPGPIRVVAIQDTQEVWVLIEEAPDGE